MEQIAGTALIGTLQRELPFIETHPEVKDLLAVLPDDLDRRLLLTAALLSLYERAGEIPATVPPIEAAPSETLEPCSKEASEVLAAVLQMSTPSPELQKIIGMELPRSPSGLSTEHEDLLPEAFELMRQRSMRLRHVMLPDILRARSEGIRRALLPVIGERGRWLARFNPDWAWVLAMGDEVSLSANGDAVWEEGKLVQLLSDPPSKPDVTCGRVLGAVPCPWPSRLSRTYVEVLHRIMGELKHERAPAAPWLYALIPGARCIEPQLIPDALTLFPAPEPTDKALRIWNVALEATSEKLELRHRLLQELTK